jgi:hypothetical protein
MSERAEVLFKRLQSAKAICALIGQSEDGDFDCKEWHPGKMATSIAKAACGFANATGGVIVIGMKAKGTGGGNPDVVQSESPVSEVGAVSSEVLDIILKQVEPGIEGVRVHTVRKPPKSRSGFVLVYIPESFGSPRRSRVDWKFYVRIASGTVPMEYFQMEDRFGRRPQARLTASITCFDFRSPFPGYQTARMMSLVVTNEGRSLARFPCVRIRQVPGVVVPTDGMFNPVPAWPVSYANQDWTNLRGGAGDVIYPGESLRIATLVQSGVAIDGGAAFEMLDLTTEVICEGMAVLRQEFRLGEVRSA